MGTKRCGHQQFSRKVYTCLQPPVEALGVANDVGLQAITGSQPVGHDT